MKKFLLFPLLAGFLFAGCGVSDDVQKNPEVTEVQSSLSQKPDRKADIYGKITALVGNQATIAKTDVSKDPTAEMSPEEKQKYMQSLSDDERAALKESIQNAVIGDVRVLFPVGIPMTKKEEMGPDAPELDASLADAKVGKIVSVWLDENQTDRNIATFVKISYSK